MFYIQMGALKVSRLILGSNPFSGFSHQGLERDMLMKRYYTTAKIKETLREAEALGINTVVARADYHMIRVLMEYWDEGGSLQWFAQTCPEVGDSAACVRRAAANGAKACHVHGGVMDRFLAQGRLDEIPPVIALIREEGMLAGVAGHNPEVFRWAEANLDLDFYMCSYYNSAHRDERAEYISGMKEWFLEEDRALMTDLIQTLSKPVIHYKIMAAGRNNAAHAFAYATERMRPGDAVCVGVFTRQMPDMLRQNAELLRAGLALASTGPVSAT